MALTERGISALKPGEKRSERLRETPGVLLVRMSEAGTREFFYRSRAGGIDRTQKLGNHGVGALSLLDARKKAKVLAGNPVALEAPGTFGDLLSAYVAHLKAQGKVSADDVERTLLRALPTKDALRKRRASAITSRDITATIARRLRKGVTVEANRLRSHLSAAFKFGMHADYNPARAAVDGLRFGITANPVAPVARIDEHPTTNGEPPAPRVLTWEELGAYWRALDAESEVIGATLRFILAVGGQRIQQVLRAGWADIEKHNAEVGMGVLRIIDAKGRGKPRRHALPIVPLAQEQLDKLAGRERPFAVTHFTLADAISRASATVCKALKCESFDQRSLRRSVETRLGDLGVSRETRGHLLSHGRTGIQNRYDFAERLEEKRDALLKLTKHLQRAIRAAK
jgi:integrase